MSWEQEIAGEVRPGPVLRLECTPARRGRGRKELSHGQRVVAGTGVGTRARKREEVGEAGESRMKQRGGRGERRSE